MEDDPDLLRLAQEGTARFGAVKLWGPGLDEATIDHVLIPGYGFVGLRLRPTGQTIPFNLRNPCTTCCPPAF